MKEKLEEHKKKRPCEKCEKPEVTKEGKQEIEKRHKEHCEEEHGSWASTCNKPKCGCG